MRMAEELRVASDQPHRDARPGAAAVDKDVIAGLRVKWRSVAWPGVAADAPQGPAFGLWTVNDPDGLLDAMTQEEFERSDERMPYFGMIWPAGEHLVDRILAGPPLDGARVLDLGCGLGICGLAAAARGAAVTFFDWEPRALEIVAASAARQSDLTARCAYVVGDWREPPPLGRFDRILAADVLYERRNGAAVAGLLARHLASGGEAWLTDPSRPQARDIPALASAAGLALIASESHILPPPEPAITFLRFARTAAV